MRAGWIIALMLTCVPASAACRKHAIWHYPWPQRCYTAYAPQPLVHRAEEQSHDWNVEITKLPPAWNIDEPAHIEVTVPSIVVDPAREQGLDRLKGLLK